MHEILWRTVYVKVCEGAKKALTKADVRKDIWWEGAGENGVGLWGHFKISYDLPKFHFKNAALKCLNNAFMK